MLLTTQYLEEADRLADQVVLIESGRALATGTADQLKDLVGGSVLEARVPVEDLDRAGDVLGGLEHGTPTIDVEQQRLALPGATAQLLSAALERLVAADIEVLELGVQRPSLDEVFLALTDTPRGGADPPREPAAAPPRAAPSPPEPLDCRHESEGPGTRPGPSCGSGGRI